MYGQASYDGETSGETYLGKINIPNDFLGDDSAPDDILAFVSNQYKGGFVVYLDYLQKGKVRAKFMGQASDEDVKKIIILLIKQFPELDSQIDDNGKPRQWEYPDAGGGIVLRDNAKSNTVSA